MTQTLVIGLDAATWRVIEPLREQGSLPNLDALIREGSSGEFNSTRPPMTPLAWTSISTGVNPGKHGIFDFLSQDPDSYQISPVSYDPMEMPAIWGLFNAADRQVGIINFPLVYPPRTVDSFFVSGIPAPESESVAHPEEAQEILDKCDFRVHPRVAPHDGLTEYFDEITALTTSQCEATFQLAETYDVELLWTVFMGLDWAQHYLWDTEIDGENAVEKLYKQVDEVIGQFRAEFEDWNIVIVSDHGARRIDGEIHVNTLLEQLGYLERREQRSTTQKLASKLVGELWNVGRNLPAPVRKAIEKQVPSETLDDVRVVAGVGQRGMSEEVDWANTEAFSYGYMGRVFLHRKDVYPEGTVSPQRSEALRNELISELEGLTHPETGEKLVANAVPGSDIYQGDQCSHAPDIVFEPTDWRFMMYGDFGDDWFTEPEMRIADHDPEGILVLSGPDFESGELSAATVDLTPTLLHIHGLPVLDHMDGEVLSEAVSGKRDVEYAATDQYNTGFETSTNGLPDEVTDRLEDLGYL